LLGREVTTRLDLLLPSGFVRARADMGAIAKISIAIAEIEFINNRYMATSEIIVWSSMLGGFATLALVALAEVVANRTVGSWRALVFIVLTASSCMLMSGWVEAVLPDLPMILTAVLKAGLAPLNGALALTYLGHWLGVEKEDRLSHSVVICVTLGLVATAVGAAGAVLLSGPVPTTTPIEFSAVFSTLGAVAGLAITVRAAILGDDLARWMVWACLCLIVMVVGMFAQAMFPSYMAWPLMALVVFCILSHFLVVTALTVKRNRMTRELLKLAKSSPIVDPGTGLPTGSKLISKVDDAIWRSARLHRACTVVCLHLGNLYEMGETAGHGVEQQILSAMTARIRRAVGFRHVVGLYHPRCFVVVISTLPKEQEVERLVLRLRTVLAHPLKVWDVKFATHIFQPRFGIGMARSGATTADATAVLDIAERDALAQSSLLGKAP
jgi:GGDEF domain-containing protein